MTTKTQPKPSSPAGGLSIRRPSSNGVEKSLKDLHEGIVRFNVDLNKGLHRRLKLYSVKKDIDMTVIVREWIKDKLNEEEIKS